MIFICGLEVLMLPAVIYPQVTVEYKKEGGAMIPIRVHTVLISTQHNEDVSNEQIHKVSVFQPPDEDDQYRTALLHLTYPGSTLCWQPAV